MRKITFIIIALGVILSLQCCASVEKKLPEPEGQLLTQIELEELYQNACIIYYTDKKDKNGIITAFPTGMQIISWKTPGMKGRDTGSFKIENGKKCDKWDTLPPSENQCWKFYKIGENEYRSESTDHRAYFNTVTVK
jgi:hypothetical protein